MNKDFENKARCVMGWTGILFIPLCILFYILFGENVEGFNPYIAFSCFYWTNARTIYIAGFITVILYFALMCSNTKLERILSIAFIICAITHLMCPLQDEDILVHNFTTQFSPLPNQDLTLAFWLHHISSYLIPVILGVYVIFVFARGKGPDTPQKKMRIHWYYGACIFTVAVVLVCVINLVTYDFNIILFCQMLCFIALSSCWIVEGGGIKALRDKEE